MKRIALLVIVCFVLLAGCSAPAVLHPPPEGTEVVLPQIDGKSLEPIVLPPGARDVKVSIKLHLKPAVEATVTALPTWYEATSGEWILVRGQQFYQADFYTQGFAEFAEHEIRPRFDPESDLNTEPGPNATFYMKEFDRGVTGLSNPTLAELRAFIGEDRTDEIEYHSYDVQPSDFPDYSEYWNWKEGRRWPKGFVCGQFAVLLRERANNAGWRSATVTRFTVSDGYLHVIVAFETSDEGLVWIEPMDDRELNVIVGWREVKGRDVEWIDKHWRWDEGIILYVW